MTGLAAGISTGYPIFEARETPGGICSSYYMEPGSDKRWSDAGGGGRYRFEYGGGHWIFGGDQEVLSFLERFVSLRKYERLSSVYFPGSGLYVPYPLQYHLAHLNESDARQALAELGSALTPADIVTMADWVRVQFGKTLNRLFFTPFHELYTAGLWDRIRPQDNYKTPLDRSLVQSGSIDKNVDVGYNAVFVYPEEGLDRLAFSMAAECDVRYGKRVVRIDPHTRSIVFEDGTTESFDTLYSTAPLIKMAEMTGLAVSIPPDPYTSVLVLNIGARRGPTCPPDQWIYVPQSDAGFHRVGFYSNVDRHFLPNEDAERMSLYIERAFLPENRPAEVEIEQYARDVVRELQSWGIISEVEVIDPTWIEVAYTWSWPGSTWIEESLEILADHGIVMLGRYGRWHFQGIAASIREGLSIDECRVSNVE